MATWIDTVGSSRSGRRGSLDSLAEASVPSGSTHTRNISSTSAFSLASQLSLPTRPPSRSAASPSGHHHAKRGVSGLIGRLRHRSASSSHSRASSSSHSLHDIEDFHCRGEDLDNFHWPPEGWSESSRPMTPPLSPPLSRGQSPSDPHPNARISASSDSSLGSLNDAASLDPDLTDVSDKPAAADVAPLRLSASRRPLPTTPFISMPVGRSVCNGPRSPPATGPGAIAGEAAARRKAEEIAAIDALETYFARVSTAPPSVEPISLRAPSVDVRRHSTGDELGIDLSAYADSPTLGGRPSTFCPADSPIIVQHSATLAAAPPAPAPLPAPPVEEPIYDTDVESDTSEDDLDRTLVGAGKAAPFEVAMFLPSSARPDGALAVAKTWHGRAPSLPSVAERTSSISSTATARPSSSMTSPPLPNRMSGIQAMPPSFARRSSSEANLKTQGRRRPLSVNLSLSPGERPSSIVFGPEDVRLLRQYAGANRTYAWL